jgi:hypothetical protein
VLHPEIDVSTKMIFDSIIAMNVIVVLNIKNKGVSKILTTVKQFPGTISLYKVSRTRKLKCTQLFSVDTASSFLMQSIRALLANL